MTWLKLSDDFADEAARVELTDREFRVHVEALLWVMRRESGGRLDRIDIRRAIEVEDPQPEIERLCALGWWQPVSDGEWQVIHSMEHQPSPERLAGRREATAERVKRHREGVSAGDGTSGRRPATGNAARNGVTRDGTGLEKSAVCERCGGGHWLLDDNGDYLCDAEGQAMKCDHGGTDR